MKHSECKRLSKLFEKEKLTFGRLVDFINEVEDRSYAEGYWAAWRVYNEK